LVFFNGLLCSKNVDAVLRFLYKNENRSVNRSLSIFWLSENTQNNWRCQRLQGNRRISLEISIFGFHSIPGELKDNGGHFGAQLVIIETDEKSFVNCTPMTSSASQQLFSQSLNCFVHCRSSRILEVSYLISVTDHQGMKIYITVTISTMISNALYRIRCSW